jgi:DNA-binding response OmpR family regulator
MKMRLELEGFQVCTAGDGTDALDLLDLQTPDLIVADIMMPRMDGWSLFNHVRAIHRLANVPFIFVTALSDDASLQRAKEMGAEDFLTKPFKAEELVASVRGRLLRAEQLAHLAKTQSSISQATTLNVGTITLDTAAHRVVRDGEEIALTPTEFRLLAHLMQRVGMICTVEDLAGAMYQTDPEQWGAPEAVRVHIKNLRRKIELDNTAPHLTNIHGVGYRLDP